MNHPMLPTVAQIQGIWALCLYSISPPFWRLGGWALLFQEGDGALGEGCPEVEVYEPYLVHLLVQTDQRE